MENLTELKARKWLVNQGYKNNEIIFNGGHTPDYTCADGKRYEVKFLYGDEILFYSTQIEKMKDDDEVLIFDRFKFIIKFKWKDRKKSHIKIRIVDNTIEKRMTIYPNKELRAFIKKEAEKQHRSMSNLVLFILNEYFEKNK